METTFYEDYYRHENSHWWFRWRYDLITKLVTSLKPDGTYRILDAGCGTGQMTKQLEDIGEAVGMDSASEAIAYARSRGVNGSSAVRSPRRRSRNAHSTVCSLSTSSNMSTTIWGS